MTRIFISYARSDSRELTLKLRDDLTRTGLHVWVDTREIQLGASFTEDIEQAIDTCDVALLLLSKGSLASSWCRVEQLRALRKGKKVIPLRVQADTEPPLHLEHLNALDFSQPERYEEYLRDLLSDIAASQAFRAEPVSPHTKLPEGRNASERRSAGAFRRAIRDLRQETWGLRQWWTYFLFHATDMTKLARIMTEGVLQAPRFTQPKARSQWDRYVRFSFRPRTPRFYDAEGFLPAGTTGPHMPVPVWLLFDMEALLLHPQARFSDGDPAAGASTFATPRAFAELPFEQIYHDSWMRGHERDEIMRHREAQVLLPESVSLEALQLIWVRSEAEYEMLRSLVSADVWQRWRGTVTARTDSMLFNHKHPYVMHAALSDERITFSFNPCRLSAGETYTAQLAVTWADGREYRSDIDAFDGRGPLVFTLPTNTQAYQVRLTLDGQLAYAGDLLHSNEVL